MLESKRNESQKIFIHGDIGRADEILLASNSTLLEKIDYIVVGKKASEYYANISVRENKLYACGTDFKKVIANLEEQLDNFTAPKQ